MWDGITNLKRMVMTKYLRAATNSVIVAAHAKDLRWLSSANIHFDECVIGEGSIDIATYMKRLVALDRDAPLMIEHMKSAEEYERCREKIFELGKIEGIDFVNHNNPLS